MISGVPAMTAMQSPTAYRAASGERCASRMRANSAPTLPLEPALRASSSPRLEPKRCTSVAGDTPGTVHRRRRPPSEHVGPSRHDAQGEGTGVRLEGGAGLKGQGESKTG